MHSSNTYLIGVDAGTTGLKTLVFDRTGSTLASAYREYKLCHPRPDHSEQDPEDWWYALATTLGDAVERAGVRPERVAGLCISFQGSTVVFAGRHCRPLRPAISWLDRRAACLDPDPEITEEDLFDITGLRSFPGWTREIVRWVGIHEPQIMRATERLLSVGDYLNYRLTGNFITDMSSASRTRMFDVESQCWSDPILKSLGIDTSILPPTAPSGALAGKVTGTAAAETGLAEGTPVFLGGFDQSCAVLGAGAASEDILLVSLGTATMTSITSTSPIVDPMRRLATSGHVLPGCWTLQAPIMTTGAVLRWWRDLSGCDRQGYYAKMDAAAEGIVPGAEGIFAFPHLGGAGAPHWNEGLKGALIGLDLSHTGTHIYRAMLEGVAYEIRANLEVIESLGFDVHQLRVVGGGARSALWRGIIGDVLGRSQVCVAELEVGALGAAMLAGSGSGVFPDAWAAARAMAPAVTLESFDESNHAQYERIYHDYMELLARVIGDSKPVVPAYAADEVVT